MARPLKPPRLYLRRHSASAWRWVIRWKGSEVSTGCDEHERAKAEEMLAAYDETRKRVKRRRHRYADGFLYFISRPDDPTYPVKVGYSGASVYMRLANVQVGCPYRLAVIASCPAHHAVELRLHLHLAATRMVGEWFGRSPAVADAIRAAEEGTITTLFGIEPPERPVLPVTIRPARAQAGLPRILQVASIRPLSAKRPYSRSPKSEGKA